MALTAQPLVAPSEHTRDALQALSDTHATGLAASAGSRNARSRAVVVLADGAQLRCRVNDLSVEGAYLIRRMGSMPAPAVAEGDPIKVFLFHPGNPLLESVTLGARIVRLEASGGPGIAIRFDCAHTNAENPDQLEWKTEVPEPVVPTAFAATAMSAPQPSTAGPTLVMTTLRAGRPIFWVSVIGLNIAAFVLLSQWLSAVL